MAIDYATTKTPSAPAIVQKRAATFAGPGRIDIADEVLPAPSANQVRIRLEGCGVCASNLPVWEGRPWFDYPFAAGAPGHEGWGVVDEVGDEVTDLNVGDRVACLSYHAFATHDVADAAHVVRLPDGDEALPFPAEPLGCAFNILNRSDIRHGHTVAVIGVGFLGALLVTLAKERGGRVLAISRRPFALDVALQMGADEIATFETVDGVATRINRLTENRGCERVIEAAGSQDSLSLAGEITAVRGRLVIAGYHQDGARTVNMQQWNWRGIDVVNAHERDPAAYIDGMRRAVAAVTQGYLDPSPLYTHRFPLENIASAMDMAIRRPDGFMKALIVNET